MRRVTLLLVVVLGVAGATIVLASLGTIEENATSAAPDPGRTALSDSVDPKPPSQPVLEPSPDKPWPMQDGSAVRDRNPSVAEHATVRDYELVRNLTGMVPDVDSFQVWATLGDVSPAEGIEVMVSVREFFGPARFGVYGQSGDLLWNTSFAQENAPGPALAGDFDADGTLETYVSAFKDHYVYEAEGRERWNTTLEQGSHRNTAQPAGVDVNGDGAMDIVDVAGLEDDGPSGEARGVDDPIVFGLDGRTGELLFRHEMPCGWFAIAPLAVEDAGGQGTLIVSACVGNEDLPGETGTMVEAFRVEPRAVSGTGVQTPFETETAWSTPVHGEDGQVRSILLGDPLPAEGREIVVRWSNETRVGYEALSLSGDTRFEQEIVLDSNAGLAPALGDLDGDPWDELVTTRTEQYRVYSLDDGSLDTLFTLPSKAELARGFDPSSDPIEGLHASGGPMLADLNGDGQLEIIDAWSCTIECDELTGSVRIHDHRGNLLEAWDFEVPGNETPPDNEVIAPTLASGVGSLERGNAPELVFAAGSRTLVFSADGAS